MSSPGRLALSANRGSWGTDGLSTTNKVVVIDDDPDVCDALKTLIELDGYSARTAQTALAGLALIGDFQPACVLLDIEMPGMDGLTLARRLTAEYGTRLVLVAVTGWQVDRIHAAAADAGFDFVLLKPFTVAQLRIVLPPVAPPPASDAEPGVGGDG